MALHTVYISNVKVNNFFGTVEIRLGDDSTAHSSSNNLVYSQIYDGGFFPIGSTLNGRYLTVRRTYFSDIC